MSLYYDEGLYEDLLEEEEEEEESEEEEEEDRGDYIIDEDDDDELDDDDEDEDEDEDEDSDEDEEESDNEDEDEDSDEDEEDEDEDGNQQIPYSRFKEVIHQRDEERELRKEQMERMEWLERQFEALMSQKPKEEEIDDTPPPYDFDQAEADYIEFVIQGEVADAAKKRREIDAARDALYSHQIKEARSNATKEATEEAKASRDEELFTAYLAEITDQYDFLDDQSDNYDEKAVRMANSLMAGYFKEYGSKYKALKTAIDDIVPLYKTEEKSKSVTRKKIARKKAVDAAKKQPPKSPNSVNRKSRNLDTVDWSKAPDKEFSKLTAKEKAKLRGDIV